VRGRLRGNLARFDAVSVWVDIAELRRAKDEHFRRSPDSPLTEEQRRSFAGLSYFDEDRSFRFVLELDRSDEGGEEEVEMSDGTTTVMRRAGSLHFNVDGATARVIAYEEEGGRLFVPFRDATSGKETYGAGRYVESEPVSAGHYELDFNRAYSPYCAYNECWRCPLPPRENWLSVAIRAGEKTFEH
jgi:uncharacterized protein (DUF1684 family)